MARSAGISGIAVGLATAGAVLAYSGIENVAVTQILGSLVKGVRPPTGPPGTYVLAASSAGTAVPGAPGTDQSLTTITHGTDAANQALGKFMAGAYGWAFGQNWTALNYGWGTLESGWNATAANASGAFGIPQALGHGTADTKGTLSNSYGPLTGMSFPTSVYVAANSGSAPAQIAWGLAYIHSRYGSPSQVPGWLGQGGYEGY